MHAMRVIWQLRLTRLVGMLIAEEDMQQCAPVLQAINDSCTLFQSCTHACWTVLPALAIMERS